MTDSSSKDLPEPFDMSMMMNKDKTMTHLLRVGTFQLEVNPSEDIDVRAFFNEVLDKLMDKYGEKLLQIDINSGNLSHNGMHG
tara:strand:- start:946 stop:1194 length:249 start_codon:yes stop_codon:yes gene_type:complete